MKRWRWLLIGVLLLLIVLYFFRKPLLWAMGNFLITEQDPELVEVLFLLGGSAFDRGNEAFRLYQEGYFEQIVCTSKNVPSDLKIAGLTYAESELSRMHLIDLGVPRKNVLAAKTATSTKEESVYALNYCQQHGIKKAMVLSNKFHTRRIRSVFAPLFKDNGIALIIRGAPSSNYKEDTWWESEEGMIMVNNEYMKLLYYAWAY